MHVNATRRAHLDSRSLERRDAGDAGLIRFREHSELCATKISIQRNQR